MQKKRAPESKKSQTADTANSSVEVSAQKWQSGNAKLIIFFKKKRMVFANFNHKTRTANYIK